MKAPDKIYLAAVEPQLNGYAGLAWTDAEDIIEPIEYIRKDAVLELLQKRNKEIEGEPKAIFRSFELQEVYRRIKEL